MEIADEQFGFIEGKGTRNAIYALRTLTERALEIQKDLYLCIIDYTRAFDKVKHNEIIKMLEDLNIDDKELRIVKHLYWQQEAAVRVENGTGKYQPIK